MVIEDARPGVDAAVEALLKYRKAQGLSKLINGNMLSDIVPTFGSLNMIGGECDH